MNNSKSLDTLSSLFDEGSFSPLFCGDLETDVFIGFGTIFDKEVYAFCQNPFYQSGGVGKNSVAKINKIYDLALKTGCPIIGIYDSNGAKIEDGFNTLNAYNSWMSKVNNLSGVVPQISIILGKCAASLAVIAQSSDFVFMKSEAQLYLNSPFVASNSEVDANFALKQGLVHYVGSDDMQVIKNVRNLIGFLPKNNLELPKNLEFKYQKNPPTSNIRGIELVDAIADDESLFNLQSGFGDAISTVLGTLEGMVVGFIANNSKYIDKNSNLKTARFIRFCDCFSIPLITLIDTCQFDKTATLDALKSISSLTHSYYEATSAKVCTILGDIFGECYLAFAAKGSANDFTFCYDTSFISTISKDAYVELLGDDKASKDAKTIEYEKTVASPKAAMAASIVDGIVTPLNLRKQLSSALKILKDKRVKSNPKKHGNITI